MLNRSILGLQTRLNTAVVFSRVLTWIGFGTVASAVALVACRSGLGIEGSALWWTTTLIGIGLIVGMVAGIRRCVSGATAAIIADSRLCAGGALMGADGEMDARLSTRIDELRVHWPARDGMTLVVCGCVMLVFAALAPTVERRASAGAVDLSRQAQSLREDVSALEEAEALTELEAEELEQAIKPLDSPGARGDAGSRWEALDAAAQRVERAATTGAQRLAESIAGADAVGAIAKSGATAASLSPELAATIGAALTEFAKEMDINPELAEAMRRASESLCSGSKEGASSQQAREALERLAQCAGSCSGASAANLESLIAKGLANPSSAAKSGAQAAEARAALAKYLKQCEGSGECSGDSLMALLVKCKTPGSGGVSRGPGAAALSWVTEAELDGARFTGESVEGQVDPTDSITLATLPRAPGPDDEGTASAGGALQDLGPASASGRSAVVLPRHRDVVRRYFDRDHEAPKKSE